MKKRYHVEINSIFIELVRVRYRNDRYAKYDINYYYKSSGLLFATEKSVKIPHSIKQHWKEWR